MVFTMCCLAAGRTRRLMNPLPATSACSSHSEGGSAATSSSASSRGLRFSARASCIAAGQEKSPCCACLGRSREISEPGCCGATLASARVSNSVRWDLTSADIEGPYYTRALIIVGRAKVEYGLPQPSDMEFELGQRRQTHVSRQGLQGIARQDPSAQGEKKGEETGLISAGGQNSIGSTSRCQRTPCEGMR